jgi:hypothetical protein
MNSKTIHVGRDKVEGIATRYWLDGLEIKCRYSRIYLNRPDLPQVLYNVHWVIPGVKLPGCGVNHPPF